MPEVVAAISCSFLLVYKWPLTLSLPIQLRLYTLPYWSNPPFYVHAASTVYWTYCDTHCLGGWVVGYVGDLWPSSEVYSVGLHGGHIKKCLWAFSWHRQIKSENIVQSLRALWMFIISTCVRQTEMSLWLVFERVLCDVFCSCIICINSKWGSVTSVVVFL